MKPSADVTSPSSGHRWLLASDEPEPGPGGSSLRNAGGDVAEYHFVSTWQIQAPIERVWEEIYHAERWPAWWKYVTGVDELEPGAADGVGQRLRLLFRTRLPYTLG